MNTSDLLSRAWGLIANAGEGDWATQGPDWHWAAARWRDDWHKYLDADANPQQPGGIPLPQIQKIQGNRH